MLVTCDVGVKTTVLVLRSSHGSTTVVLTEAPSSATKEALTALVLLCRSAKPKLTLDAKVLARTLYNVRKAAPVCDSDMWHVTIWHVTI